MREKFRLDITGISMAALRVHLGIAREEFHETVTLEIVYNCLAGCYTSRGMFDGIMLIIAADSIEDASRFMQTLQGAGRRAEVYMFSLHEVEV